MPLLPGRAVPGPKPSCSILLGQYPNYQRATRPQCNRLATVGRRDYAAGRPVLRSAGPGSPGGPVQRPAPGRPVAGRRPAAGARRAVARPASLRCRRCGDAGILCGRRHNDDKRLAGRGALQEHVGEDPMVAGAGTVAAAGMPGAMSAARAQRIRALNEQLLLGHIRDHGPCSRADLARLSGLSKPTVSLALATVEQAGLVREAGQRIGRPGRSALLYEIRPDAGFVLGLDVGAQYVRGALTDLAGEVR